MSDGRLRQLQRTWEGSRELADAVALDEACQRIGAVSDPRAALRQRLVELLEIRSRSLFFHMPKVTGPIEHVRAYYNGRPLDDMERVGAYFRNPSEYAWRMRPDGWLMVTLSPTVYAPRESLMEGDAFTVAVIADTVHWSACEIADPSDPRLREDHPDFGAGVWPQ